MLVLYFAVLLIALVGFFLKFQLFTLFEIVFFCQIDTRQTFLKEFKNQSTRIFTCISLMRNSLDWSLCISSTVYIYTSLTLLYLQMYHQLQREIGCNLQNECISRLYRLYRIWNSDVHVDFRGKRQRCMDAHRPFLKSSKW